MKKGKLLLTLIVVLTIITVLFAACSPKQQGNTQNNSSTNNQQQTQTSNQRQTQEFNPDEAKDGITFTQMREQFGPVPKPTGEVKLGAVAKAFENEFWRILKQGMETAVQKMRDKGYNVTIDVRSAQGENDEQGQLAIVYDMINKKYNALLLSPISDANLNPGVEEALRQNIPVINVNDGIIAIAPNFIGPNAKQNGVLAAEWIAKKLNGEGKVAIVIGMPKAYAARERTLGFEEWIKNNAPKIEIVEKQNADWDREKAKELADIWIKKHPDLKAIFCNNDVMALGVVEAVKASGKHILVVGVDGTEEALASIRKGELSATIKSFPEYMGQIAVEGAMRILGGQKLPRVIWTPQALIDSTNVNTPAAEIIKWQDPTFE